MEQLLGGEVYLYHIKMMLKEPRVGGAWEWHQDYGYWYHNGCLFPASGELPDCGQPGQQDNGCLQVLRGSHLLGRIDHGKTGDQTGATWSTWTRPSSGTSVCTSSASRATRSSSTAISCTASDQNTMRTAAVVAHLLLQRDAQ